MTPADEGAPPRMAPVWRSYGAAEVAMVGDQGAGLQLAKRVVDITGQRFGSLTVLKFAGLTTAGHVATWECRCDCGALHVTRGDVLRRGGAKSCGCSWRGTPLEERCVPEPTTGCLLFDGCLSAAGYGEIRIGNRKWYAHRLAWMAANGPIPPGMFVCHRCDTPACCNPAHLFLGTAADNNADARRKGRHAHGDRSGARTRPDRIARGSRSPMAKLTESDVRAIRSLYAAGGWTHRRLAERFGVSDGAIQHVVDRKNWKHVGDNE